MSRTRPSPPPDTVDIAPGGHGVSLTSADAVIVLSEAAAPIAHHELAGALVRFGGLRPEHAAALLALPAPAPVQARVEAPDPLAPSPSPTAVSSAAGARAGGHVVPEPARAEQPEVQAALQRLERAAHAAGATPAGRVELDG